VPPDRTGKRWWKHWLWVGGLVLLAATAAYAARQSVTIQARWRVLPYQSLRFSGSTDEILATGYTVPPLTSLDVARGYIEEENAVRLHVVSNTPWKIQVWTDRPNLEGTPPGDVQVRRHGGEYVSIVDSPQLLAAGLHGTYEIGVDYRILLGEDTTAFEEPVEIVYTIMSE